jgi:two-component system vancomycin resistance associated response regulator VraR
MALRIVLGDAYKIALLGMEDMLKTIRDFEVVGFFTESKELLECLKKNKVDVAVINLMLKSNHDLGIIGEMKEIQPELRVIAMVNTQEPLVIKRTIELGASAIIGKDTSYSDLVSTITSVAKGNVIYPDVVMEDVDNAILSDMERQVLELIANERTNDEIAKQLYLSRRTVETYVSNICEKLGSINRVGAVRRAMEIGILN